MCSASCLSGLSGVSPSPFFLCLHLQGPEHVPSVPFFKFKSPQHNSHPLTPTAHPFPGPFPLPCFSPLRLLKCSPKGQWGWAPFWPLRGGLESLGPILFTQPSAPCSHSRAQGWFITSTHQPPAQGGKERFLIFSPEKMPFRLRLLQGLAVPTSPQVGSPSRC